MLTVAMLYGQVQYSYVYIFSVECSQITEISSNPSLLPPGNIDYSSVFDLSYMNVSDVWCASHEISDPSPYVTWNFTEQVYLIYAVVRGDSDSFNSYYVTKFSFVYENQSDERVTYMNVGGVSVRYYTCPYIMNYMWFVCYSFLGCLTLMILMCYYGHRSILATYVSMSMSMLPAIVALELTFMDVQTIQVGISYLMDYIICYVPLVVNHALDEVSVMETTTEAANPTSCADRLEHQQSSVIITVTTTVPAVTLIRTVSMTPQSSCSCSDQQQASASSSSDSDVVTICVPVVVVFGVIILIVVVIIGILIWRKAISRSHALPYDKVVPNTTTVENDLYG